jgi:hypothetical protein
MRIAFVLSGGASLGASQGGMLQALYEHGIRLDLLVGTSAGRTSSSPRWIAVSRTPPMTGCRSSSITWRSLSRQHRVQRRRHGGHLHADKGTDEHTGLISLVTIGLIISRAVGISS